MRRFLAVAVLLLITQCDSHIRGTVLDSNGQSVANMLVGLERLKDCTRDIENVGLARTDSSGRFSFRTAAGDYLIVANPLGPSPTRPFPAVFYPDVEAEATAATAHLASCGVLEGYTIALPKPWTPANVHTQVLFPDGSPARGAYVSAHDIDYLGSAEPAYTDTDSDGKATLIVYEGRTYYLDATITEGTHQRCAGPLKFTASDGLVLDTITIEHNWGDCLAQLSRNFDPPH
jgi:hypothetical protein